MSTSIIETVSVQNGTAGVIESVREVLVSTSGLRVHYDPAAEEGQAGVFKSIDELGLPEALAEAVRAKYPQGLFRHQDQAVREVLAGKHTVVASRTSSGKSLIFSLPVLAGLLKDKNSTALFLYPQKALANDQQLKLRELAAAVPALATRMAAQPNLISRYDGGVEDGLRQTVRKEVQVLLTNPDMLHVGILSQHGRYWKRFLANLKYVVIDECHEYRGIFGTNVAYVIRRLRQLCKRYGSSPVFVATSATVSDPQAHLEKLTGLPFGCVGAASDGSFQGRRKFWMVSPQDGNYFEMGRDLGLALAQQGLTSLVFCPSRISAEKMTGRLLSRGEQLDFVRVYRAGLSAAERESIEAGLRDKSVKLVFCTNALELGIDIGAIDVVICVGLPTSMMSLRQRIGRAARGGREGAVILVPADSPIDSYYAAHAEELFARENETLALNLANRHVVHGHYACAAQEVEGEEQLDGDTLGPEMAEVQQLRAAGKLNEPTFYRASPHADISLRNMGDGQYCLRVGDEKVGDIDNLHLLREAYPNGIYRHGGRSYRVRDVFQRDRVVKLMPDWTGHETTPVLMTRIRVKRCPAVADYTALTVSKVTLDVTESLVSVVEKAGGTMVRQWPGSGGLRGYCLPTVGTRLELKRPLWQRLVEELGAEQAKEALESCQRLMASLFPTIDGPCDARDFSSASDVSQGQAAIYLYDLVYDGVDLTTCAFDRMVELLERAKEQVGACPCEGDQGCFRCVADPRNDAQPSKAAALRLLETVLDVLHSQTPKVIATAEAPEDAANDGRTVECPKCHSVLVAGARFCHNCGERQE